LKPDNRPRVQKCPDFSEQRGLL